MPALSTVENRYFTVTLTRGFIYFDPAYTGLSIQLMFSIV